VYQTPEQKMSVLDKLMGWLGWRKKSDPPKKPQKDRGGIERPREVCVKIRKQPRASAGRKCPAVIHFNKETLAKLPTWKVGTTRLSMARYGTAPDADILLLPASDAENSLLLSSHGGSSGGTVSLGHKRMKQLRVKLPKEPTIVRDVVVEDGIGLRFKWPSN
jgi:hypothetical protein